MNVAHVLGCLWWLLCSPCCLCRLLAWPQLWPQTWGVPCGSGWSSHKKLPKFNQHNLHSLRTTAAAATASKGPHMLSNLMKWNIKCFQTAKYVTECLIHVSNSMPVFLQWFAPCHICLVFCSRYSARSQNGCCNGGSKWYRSWGEPPKGKETFQLESQAKHVYIQF